MASFDQAAYDYDQEFTYSEVGRLQRDRVWHYLKPLVEGKKTLNILELNCGTGEDACRLAAMGHKVWATDASLAMLEIAQKKAESRGTLGGIQFLVWDLNEMCPIQNQSFDLILSNFAGLNCLDIDGLTHISEPLHSLVRPGGKMVAVFLSTRCLWERFYLSWKGGDPRRRESKETVQVPVSGTAVSTWYYPPQQLTEIFNAQWQVHKIKPIGLFLPPSYLNPFFDKRRAFLKGLNWLEKSLGTKDKWANYADHFLMEWEARS